MIKIDTSPVNYYSQLDEDHFFYWAQEIPCVTSIKGGFFHVESIEVTESDLRDLIAIMYRYKMSMKCLSQFLNKENEHWFKDPEKYWYESVFKNA